MTDIEVRTYAIARRVGAIYGMDAIREVVTELAESDARVSSLIELLDAERLTTQALREDVSSLQKERDEATESFTMSATAMQKKLAAAEARITDILSASGQDGDGGPQTHGQFCDWLRSELAEVSRLREERDTLKAALGTVESVLGLHEELSIYFVVDGYEAIVTGKDGGVEIANAQGRTLSETLARLSTVLAAPSGDQT